MEEDLRTELLNARPVWNIEHVGTMIKVFIPSQKQTFYANVGEEIEWTLLDGSTQKITRTWSHHGMKTLSAL